MSEAGEEALRCLSCGCVKREDCSFREAVTAYCHERRTKLNARREVKRITTHPDIVFEPGKCIKCGRCVRIARREKEPLGLTYIGRGFEVTVAAPFGEDIRKALTRTAAECAAACPTAALSLKKEPAAVRKEGGAAE